MTTKIVLYSMNYSEGLLKQLPYFKFYGERGFSHLSSLKEPDTRVVLVMSEPPHPYTIGYHLRDVFGFDARQQRAAHRRLAVLTPESGAPLPLDALVLEDKTLVQRLKNEARQSDAVLVNFVASDPSDRLAEELGVPLEQGPFPASRRWGDKASNKELFSAENIPAPRGKARAFATMAELTKAAVALVAGTPAAEKVILKLNDAQWADALGNVVIDGKQLRETNDLSASVERMLQGWDSFVHEVAAGGAIVEEYYSKPMSSPSGQARIDRNGGVHIVSTHEQYTVADQYLGGDFPAHDEDRPQIHAALAAVGQQLAKTGVRGTFGIDFIGLGDGRLLATEINLRKVGPSHVLAYAEAVVGSSVDPDGNLVVDGTCVYYTNRWIFEPESLRGRTPAAAVAALVENGLLYDHHARKGALLHILGALEPAGYVETTCFGSSRDEARDISEQVRAILMR